MTSRRLTGAQILWESLVREGVTCVFGYPGGAILPAYDAMLDYPIRHVLVRHEQGATHMADGYARATGQVGVAIATSGPGATNLVTGIATAMMDSSPIVCITGQVGSKLIGSDAFQECDITGITLPITKHNYLLTQPEDVAATVRAAFHVARSGRPGPVLIDMTKDCQQKSCDFAWSDVPPLEHQRPDLRPGDAALARAVDLINEAKRPLILAGNGIIASGASDLVRKFAEHTDIPIAMTLLGIGGVPASHPLNLGMMGMHGEAWVNTSIQEADLLIALGMRFDDRVTGNLKTYALNAKKIHLEIDRSEINKNVKVDVGLVGDVGQLLQQLTPRVEPGNHAQWRAHIDALKGDSAVIDIQRLPDSGHLYAAHVINDLWRETGGKAVVVTDVGQHQMWEAQYYHHETPRSLITSGGLGTMGFALPAAIGAKVARPDAEVWVVVGDGGFQMTVAELATAKLQKVPVKILVINNHYLGMIRQWQELFFDNRLSGADLEGNPDFIKLAAAYDIPGKRVTRAGDVDKAIKWAMAYNEGPCLIDAEVVKEDNVFPMIPAGAPYSGMIVERPKVKMEKPTGST